MHYIYTGSIGDFLAWLGFVPDYPTKITLATARADSIAEICYMLGIPVEIIDSSRRYDIKCQLEAVRGPLPGIDASNGQWFPKVVSGEWKPQRNPIGHLDFPRIIGEPYDIFVPASLNVEHQRNLDRDQLDFCIKSATRKLVVLYKVPIKLPESDKIINLSGKTNMFEASCFIRHCSGYWGTDTWASVACAQQGVRCVIKSRNPYWYMYRQVYCHGRLAGIIAHPHLQLVQLDPVEEESSSRIATLDEVQAAVETDGAAGG